MYVAHQQQGPLSLGVIHDCELAVGNPQNLGGGTCITPQEMYDRRRMPVMFGEPVIRRDLDERGEPATRSDLDQGPATPTSDTSSATEAHRAGQNMDDSDGSNNDALYGTDDENTFNWLGEPVSRTDDEEPMSDGMQAGQPSPRWYIGQHTRDWLEGRIQTGTIDTGSGPWDPDSLRESWLQNPPPR